jgi:hypothetical protein
MPVTERLEILGEISAEIYQTAQFGICVRIREEDPDREVGLWPDQMDALCEWWTKIRPAQGKGGEV